MYNIIWDGIARLDLNHIIRQELDEMLEDLDGDVKNLIFHTIFLTDDFDGPAIIIACNQDSGDILAEYVEDTKWITIEDEKF